MEDVVQAAADVAAGIAVNAAADAALDVAAGVVAVVLRDVLCRCGKLVARTSVRFGADGWGCLLIGYFGVVCRRRKWRVWPYRLFLWLARSKRDVRWAPTRDLDRTGQDDA